MMDYSKFGCPLVFALTLILTTCAGAPDPENTPLHTAAESGDLPEVERLLAAGASVDAGNRYGAKPLHDAAAAGHPRVVARLLDAGAEVNATDDVGTTALHSAAFTDDAKVWEHLLAAGGDIDAYPDFGDTPITEAARRGNVAAPITALQRLGRARVLLATGLESFADKSLWEDPGALWENAEIVLSKALTIGPAAEFTILARFVHTGEVNGGATLLWGSDRPLVQRSSSHELQFGLIGRQNEAWERVNENPSGYMTGPVSYRLYDGGTARNQAGWTYLPSRASTLVVIDRDAKETSIIPRGSANDDYRRKVVRRIAGANIEEPKNAQMPPYNVPSEPLFGSRFGYWMAEGFELDYLVVVQFTESYNY